MAQKATKICRVCGEEYQACRTVKKRPGVFYWKEVACSPEHGEEYLRQVLEARGVVDKIVEEPQVEPDAEVEVDEEDALFEPFNVYDEAEDW